MVEMMMIGSSPTMEGEYPTMTSKCASHLVSSLVPLSPLLVFIYLYSAGNADSSRWDYLRNNLVNKDMSNANNYNEMQEYLNVERFADYLILAFWIGLSDWPQNNWYVINRNAASPLGPTPSEFQPWDGEWSLDSNRGGGDNGAYIQDEFVNGSGGQVILDLWHSLRESSEFRALFAQRVAVHTGPGGALTDDAAIQRWDILNEHIRSAIVGESARWGDSLGGSARTRDEDWQDEVDSIRNLLSGNTQRLINELRDTGIVTTIPPISTPEPSFAVTELSYHPSDPTEAEIAAGFTDKNMFEYIELVSIAVEPLDLSGLEFTLGIVFSGPSQSIEPDEVFVVVADPAAFAFRYGNAPLVIGTYTGALSNGGENIVIQYEGTTIADFTYDDDATLGWPTE